jgi:membrane protease subunit HflC
MITVGRGKIMNQVLEAAKPKLASFGIDLIDVKVKRLNYREDVRESVYERMIAERTQIVEKLHSQGRGEAQKISGDKERELKRITSEAYRASQIIKGQADATSTQIFAEAFSRDPEFYSFVKTLEVYKDVFDSKSSLVLSTDSDFLKYLKKVE